MAPNVYQITAGGALRSYAETLLKHGVALIAPGDGGPWSPERYAYDFALSGFLRRFAEEMHVGDLVLLRSGSATVVAVGVVASEYLYLEQFDDVNGMDLQHARRVRWFRLPIPYAFTSAVFGAGPTRFSRVTHPEARDFAQRFAASPPVSWQSGALPPLPPEEPPLEAIPDDVRDVVALVADVVPLYLATASFGEPPSEHELVAQLVVPFLRALGWRPEQIGVEWRTVDVVGFRTLPRSPENCHLIMEAKRLGAGVEGALEQAKGYLVRLGIQRDVVVTDGVRYRMYSGRQEFAPMAYANLARLKRSASDLFAALRRP